ncbi:ATP-binding cassette domain-containing protein [Candidatus Gracilibacteria bacterium]|nr:ATP-binding cassette domain-containing protein [Candidatus Gracilibacteria bacterium]
MTENTKNAIVLKNLQKSYGQNTVLDKIQLEIPENSIFGLLGPNGAGKSTILKIISKIIKKDDGDVIFFGKSMEQNDLEDIGVLINEPVLYESNTGYQNIKIFALLSGKKVNTDELLDLVGLEKKARKRKVGTYSLGMKQRLAVAVALVGNPKLIILDEPLNGIDIEGVIEFRDILKKIQAKGVTIILSSHILSEVQKTCEFIGVIHGGKVKFNGKKEDFLKDSTDMEESYLKIIH